MRMGGDVEEKEQFCQDACNIMCSYIHAHAYIQFRCRYSFISYVFSSPSSPSSILELFKFKPLEDRVDFREVDFLHFIVIAALSERIAALDPWVRKCVAALDIIKLHQKISRARSLFICNDPNEVVRF